MSQNQEIIESKLCSFVDGELDEAGRAEIEKHLTANPQHRRLLEELRRTSALVRGLPRENAPPELAESYNSQLERSVLLQGIGEESTGSGMRIGLGPRLYAAAAIILLMIGLAAVIYFALPSYNVHPTMASSSVRQPMPAPHPSAAPSAIEPSDQSPADQSPSNQRIVAGKNVPDNANSIADSEKHLSAPSVVKSTSGEQSLVSARLEESNQLRALAHKAATDTEALGVADANAGRRQIRAAAVPSVAPGAMVMLVDSDDLDRTHRRLEDYFAAHDIAWAPADPSDESAKRELDAARGADRALTLRSGGDQNKDGQVKSAPAAADAPIAPIPPGAIAGASTQPTTQPQEGQGIVGNAHDAVAAAPQTEPSVLADSSAPALPLSLQPETGSAKPGAPPTAQQVVFAARMSRRQAAALGDILEREGAAEQARVVQDGASPLAVADKLADELTLNETRAKAGAAFGAGLPASRPSVALAPSVAREPEKIAAKEELKKVGGGPTTQFAQAAASTRPDETEQKRDLTEREAPNGRGSASSFRKDAVAEKDTTQPATTAPTDGLLAEAPAPSPAPVENAAASLLQSTTQPDAAENGTAALSLSPAGSEELVNVVILIRPNNATPGAPPALTVAPQTHPSSPATEPAVEPPAGPASQPAAQ